MSPEEQESLWNIWTAAGAALVGLLVGVREFVGRPRKIRKLESRLDEIEGMLKQVLRSEASQDVQLEKISDVEEELADVLKHPRDSGFGTDETLSLAKEIIAMLKDIRDELHEIRLEQERLRGKE